MRLILWIVSAVIAVVIVGIFYKGSPLAVAANLGNSFALCLVVAAILLPVRGLLALFVARKNSAREIESSTPQDKSDITSQTKGCDYCRGLLRIPGDTVPYYFCRKCNANFCNRCAVNAGREYSIGHFVTCPQCRSDLRSGRKW
jgi:hypothetical protein